MTELAMTVNEPQTTGEKSYLIEFEEDFKNVLLLGESTEEKQLFVSKLKSSWNKCIEAAVPRHS